MTNTVSAEIYWLSWTVILAAAMVIPYAVYRVRRLGGLWQAFLRPLPGDSPFADEWAHRAYRAHMNAFEGIAMFAPAVLAVQATGTGTEMTAIASAIYFWARLIYAPLYYFSVPIFRTAIWFVGLAATLYLAFHVVVHALA
ncbi:MAG: MAPEG family protein [Rhodospirillales bacterium]|nr:MAPEG family protein [Rhodospirillales bacterium]MDH3967957.1 MAPEG family protein [Rhodospirillales bacterium]